MTADPKIGDTIELAPAEMVILRARAELTEFYRASNTQRATEALARLRSLLGVELPVGPPLTAAERAMLDSDVEVVVRRTPLPPKPRASKYSAKTARGSWP